MLKGRSAGSAATRLELFVGKGGVGKTTLACAAAFTYARAGQRVLLASIDQAHSLGDVLGVTMAHDRGTVAGTQSVAPGVEAIEIDSLALLENRFRELLSAMPIVGGHRHGPELDALDPAELTGLPGAQELLALNEIKSFVDGNTWDIVVVDCGPSADLLRTLTAPEMLLGYLERLWPQQQRMAVALGMDPGPAVLAACVDRVVSGVDAIRALVADRRRTGAVLVTAPERVAVAEAVRTRSAAALLGLRLAGVVVNKVFPDLGAPQRSDRAGRWYRERRAEQLEVVAQLESSMAGVPTMIVGHADGEPIGPAGLAALGPISVGSAEPTAAADPTVELESGEGLNSVYALRMQLPLVDRSTLRLGRVGDALILGADGVRGRVRLASVLRRCSVAGAELDGADLVVRFQPDPEVWPG